jgi:hypothetical protein
MLYNIEPCKVGSSEEEKMFSNVDDVRRRFRSRKRTSTPSRCSRRSRWTSSPAPDSESRPGANVTKLFIALIY